MPDWCPKCRAMLSPGLGKCPNCGAALASPDESPIGTSDIPWLTVYILRLMIVPLVILVALGVVCLIFGR